MLFLAGGKKKEAVEINFRYRITIDFTKQQMEFVMKLKNSKSKSKNRKPFSLRRLISLLILPLTSFPKYTSMSVRFK